MIYGNERYVPGFYTSCNVTESLITPLQFIPKPKVYLKLIKSQEYFHFQEVIAFILSTGRNGKVYYNEQDRKTDMDYDMQRAEKIAKRIFTQKYIQSSKNQSTYFILTEDDITYIKEY